MSVFSTGMNHRSFLWQITALCFVLGLLMSAAWQTATQIKHAGVSPQRPGFFYGSDFQVAQKKAAEYEKEINKLNAENARLMKGKDANEAMSKKLIETRLFAGLTQVSGPGIQVTLLDSAHRNGFGNDPINQLNLIHDADIVLVVNELKAAGAEALAVNGERIIGMSAIRCFGPVVHVNNVPAAPPYIIQAVGDQNALYGGINLPNGVLDRLRQFDPNMVKVERKEKMVLPAFAGGTQMHIAHEAKANEDGSIKESNTEPTKSDKGRSDSSKSESNRSDSSQSDRSQSDRSQSDSNRSDSSRAGDSRTSSEVSESAGASEPKATQESKSQESKSQESKSKESKSQELKSQEPKSKEGKATTTGRETEDQKGTENQ